jgi:CRP-like cAMP-binding protein
MAIKSFLPDEIVFRENETGDRFYQVLAGQVEVFIGYETDDERQLTLLGPGTFFGEMGMIDGEVRSATAVVEEDGTYVEIIRPEDLQKLFETNPVEVDQIMRHLSHRLRRLTEDYTKACQEVEELSKQ